MFEWWCARSISFLHPPPPSFISPPSPRRPRVPSQHCLATCYSIEHHQLFDRVVGRPSIIIPKSRAKVSALLCYRPASHAPNARIESTHTTVHHDLKHPSRWLRRAHLFNTATAHTHLQRQCPPSPARVCPPPLQRRLPPRVARLQQQEERPRKKRSATSASSAIALSRAQNIGRDMRGPVSTLF